MQEDDKWKLSSNDRPTSAAGLVDVFVQSYFYIVWFVCRKSHFSIHSIGAFQLIQVTSAPGFLFACYEMSVYFAVELLTGIRFSGAIIYIYMLTLILFSMMIVWRFSGKTEIEKRFSIFLKLSNTRRKIYDFITWCAFILAIPLALLFAVMVRDKHF